MESMVYIEEDNFVIKRLLEAQTNQDEVRTRQDAQLDSLLIEEFK